MFDDAATAVDVKEEVDAAAADDDTADADADVGLGGGSGNGVGDTTFSKCISEGIYIILEAW